MFIRQIPVRDVAVYSPLKLLPLQCCWSPIDDIKSNIHVMLEPITYPSSLCLHVERMTAETSDCLYGHVNDGCDCVGEGLARNTGLAVAASGEITVFWFFSVL